MRHLTLLTLALFVCASAAEAQTVPSSSRRGLASALAAGLSSPPSDRLSSGGQLLPERVLIKAPLDQATPPAAWSLTGMGTGSPQYSMDAMFGPAQAALIEIDAQSIGSDIIPQVDSSGQPDLSGAMSWMGVVVSYDNEATGQVGSNIQRRRQLPSTRRTSPGADLHSHYLAGSTGLSPTLVGRTMVEIPSEALGYSATADDDPDALDFGLGVLHHAQATSTLVFFQSNADYYFSVSPASADALNDLTGGSFAQGTPAHPATIYRISWDGSAWSAPVVHLDYATLELGAADDVDGLAVDPGSGSVIFSTQVALGRSQLQAYHANVGRVSLRDGNGALVSVRLGGVDDTDNIDAVCVLDPHAGEFGTHVGTPDRWLAMLPDNKELGISVTQHRPAGASVGSALVQVTGPDLPQASVMVLYASLDYDPRLPWTSATWVPLGLPVAQAPGQQVSEFELALAQGMVLPEVSVVGVLVDAQGAPLATSWMSRLRIDNP